MANSESPIEPKGHQTELDLPPGQALAQQRSHADAHREDCQQQRGDVFVSTQHVLGEVGELREERRAIEPEPRDAEHRQPHDPVALGEAKVAPGFGERVPVDPQIRGHGRRRRDPSAHQITRKRHRDGGRAGQDRTIRFDGDHQTADDFAKKNGDEGAHLDQPVAADELVLAQVLRQDRVLDGPEECRMHTHQAQRQEEQDQVAPIEADRADDHDADLEQLDETDQPRLLVLVGDLARGRREQHERCDEYRRGDVDQVVRGQRGERRRLERDEDHQRILVDVVVARAEKLRPEERREAALAQ